MDITSVLRSNKEEYEQVAANDPEDQSSDESTITGSAEENGWKKRNDSNTRRAILLSIWHYTRLLLLSLSSIILASSLWLTYSASHDLDKARHLLESLGSRPIPTQTCRQDVKPDTIPPPDPSPSRFISGATLPAAGYGLVYNTSYCNGWDDPFGAIRRGCVLDPTQGGWIHELCHDPDLVKEWMKLPDFGWYLDSKRKHKISQERVWAADIPGGIHTTLYTAMDFHVQHCKFVMRLRIKHGMRKNRGLGYIPLDPGHMNHCLHLMTEEDTPTAKSKTITKVILGEFGGGTEGFGLGGECYMPVV